MRSHRFAPEEKNKENENDTDCLCDGSRSVADVGDFRDCASRTHCAVSWRCHHRPKQCDAGLLVSSSLVSSPLVSPSPSLLARLLRPRALPLVTGSNLISDRRRRGVFFLLSLARQPLRHPL